MFTPISEAPPALAEHFRYPEDLFDLQSQVFSAYHVTDPTAFYNGEDRWEIAAEPVETDGEAESVLRPMEAYYMTLPLPGESETGFKLIRPFTPINRPNMTAWMAAQSDPLGNARLVVYRFPRQVTVFGPQQVEARINQDPEISSRFTLLGQSGSRVISGNLLVLPVEETVMYVQPVYLQATGTEGAPTELTYVIVATGEEVEMRPTLEEALAAITGDDEADGPGAATAECRRGSRAGRRSDHRHRGRRPGCVRARATSTARGRLGGVRRGSGGAWAHSRYVGEIGGRSDRTATGIGRRDAGPMSRTYASSRRRWQPSVSLTPAFRELVSGSRSVARSSL